MVATVKFLQMYFTTILLLLLLQMVHSIKNEVPTMKTLKDNPVKDLLFYGDQTVNAGKTHILIKRQSRTNRYTQRPVPLPILVGGGFGTVVGRGFGARGPLGRGPVGARSFGARGLGGRGIGGLGGRGRG